MQKAAYTCTLLGITHTAPQSFYDVVQEYVTVADAMEHTIFYEGVSSIPKKEPETEEARKVMTVLETVTRTYWNTAPADGRVSQEGSFVLPPHAVCADVDMGELAEFFVQHGIFDIMSSSQVLDYFVGRLYDADLVKLLNMPVVFRRDLHAAVVINERPRNSLVIYGEGHIYGLKRWLELSDWRCRSTEQYYLIS